MCMLAILAYVYTSSLKMHGVVRHDTVGVVGCNHAEADTRICLHAKVAMIHHAWKCSATLWMDTGTYNGKNRRCVNLSAIAMRIGLKMCQALPAYHAFTGTDYTSAIIRKGRVGPFRQLESSSDAQYALITITSGNSRCVI